MFNLLAITTFRDLVVSILGDLSPNMYFLYDIVAVILAFLFFLIIYRLFDVVLTKLKRW